MKEDKVKEEEDDKRGQCWRGGKRWKWTKLKRRKMSKEGEVKEEEED